MKASSPGKRGVATPQIGPSLAFDLHRFKITAERVLPPGHPLLPILRRTPDVLSVQELLPRLDDWLILLEG